MSAARFHGMTGRVMMVVVIIASGAGQRGYCQEAAKKVVRADLTLEPLRAEWSVEKATEYLDKYADRHETKKQCLNCHATYAYLPVRPLLPSGGEKHAQRRAATEDWAQRLLKENWPAGAAGKAPVDRTLERRITEALLTGTVLAQHDGATTGELQPVTRESLALMWKLQREDGAWHWLKTAEPPSSTDDHYGATMVAIGVGRAPGGYAQTATAAAGLEKMRGYFKAHPPRHLHQKLLLLWAEASVGGILSETERAEIVSESLAQQREDGGWAMATLADWKRIDNTPQETIHSDGYGTGLVVYVLRTAGGVPAGDERIQRAIGWIKANQRESGYWYARSPKIGDDLSTYVGTVYTVMAMEACGELRAAEGQAGGE